MCQGKSVKTGKPCKNKQEPYCRHHKPTGDEPAYQFPVSVEGLSRRIQNKIQTRLEKPPSKSDGPGYLYVYTLETDSHDSYYKIGRTARTPEKRLKEWKGGILKKAYAVNHQKKAERLVHLYLDYARVYRYETPDGYCSIWKDNGEPVGKRDARRKKAHTLEARKKHIEWFRETWRQIKPVIEALVAL